MYAISDSSPQQLGGGSMSKGIPVEHQPQLPYHSWPFLFFRDDLGFFPDLILLGLMKIRLSGPGPVRVQAC